MNYDIERLESRRRRRQKKVYERINTDRYFFRQRFRINMEEFGNVLNVLKPIFAHHEHFSLTISYEYGRIWICFECFRTNSFPSYFL